MTPARSAHKVQRLLALACVLLLCEMLVGAFPFSSVEGDEQAVINGVQEMIRPRSADLRWRYDYPVQPGAYWLTIGAHALTRAAPGLCYYALSAACAFAFAFVSAAFVSRLSGLGLVSSLTLTLLCQEVQRGGFYANSSTFGGLFVLLGLWSFLRVRRPGFASSVIAGVLFGLGGWCRLDALVLTPVLLVLAWHRTTPGRAIALTAAAAFSSLAALGALDAAAHVSPGEILGVYSGRSSNLGFRSTIVGFYEIGSLGLFLAAGFGITSCLRRREYWPLLLAAGGLGPTLFLYAESVTTPKYLYYLTPILAFLAAEGVRAAVAMRRLWPGFLAVTAVAAEWLTGLRTTRTEFRRFTPEPTLAAIAPIHVGTKRLEWVVGAGEIIPNDDGFSLWTGLGYAGIAWHREKANALRQIGNLHQVIDRNPRLAVLTSTYASYQCAVGHLRQTGFSCADQLIDPIDPASHLDRWQSGPRVCWLAWINEGSRAPALFAEDARRFSGLPTYFFNDMGAAYAKLLLAVCPGASLVGDRDDGLFALYRLTADSSHPKMSALQSR